MPDKIPAEMETSLKSIKQNGNRLEFLKALHAMLSSKFPGSRHKTITHLTELFTSDPEILWRKPFLHCTNLNYIAAVMILRSGLFEKDDIKTKWTLLWFFSPHQYLKIRTGPEEWINLDIWAATFGIPFGDYGHGFHIGIKTASS